MPNERLNILIFQGLLPSAYVVLDNGSDVSKWTQDAANPWTAINTGAAYGYLDRGLRFSADVTAFADTFLASRRVLAPITNSYVVGITFRFLNPVGVLDPAQRALVLRYYPSGVASGTTRELSARFNLTTMPGPVTDNLEITVRDNSAFPGAMVAAGTFMLGANYATLPAWIRCELTVVDGVLRNVRVNGQPLATNITLFDQALPKGAPAIRGLLQLMGEQLVGGVVTTVHWDVAQIWISDSENIV